MKIDKKKISHIPLRVRRKTLHLWERVSRRHQRPVRRAHSPLMDKMDAVQERLPPRFLFLQINQNCDLRCTHCNLWMNDEEQRSKLRSVERDREMIEEFARLSPYGSLVFCGGEPMLNMEEWFDLTAHARRSGLRILSVTHGGFIQTLEMAERVIVDGPDEISISLDSPDPDVHDRMRGVPGSFDRAVNALRLLLEARARHSELNRTIIAVGLVGKSVYEKLEAFYNLVLNEMGADKLKLNMVQPTFGSPRVDPFFEEEGDVDPRRFLKVLNRCEKRFSLDYNPAWKKQVVMYFRTLRTCRDRGKGWRTKSGTDECICNAADRNIIVNLQGDARHCFRPGAYVRSIQQVGDLEAFWRGRQSARSCMLNCNSFGGISNSLKAESCTLSGIRKAEQFIEQSLEHCPFS